MESKTENESNPLNTSEEIRKKAREELNRQLQGLINNKPIENFTDENIEDEVNRLMEEVDTYEKNYIPKEIDDNAFNELKQFEEEFGQEIDEEDEKDEEEIEKEEKEEKEDIINTNSKPVNIKDSNNKTKNKNNKKEKKTKFDLDFEIEDLEDIIEKDYESSTNKNKANKKNKSEDITQDKEIKELLKEYERQLDIEVEREYQKEYKPKIDQNDLKRAEILLKKDPLLNEAIVQGIIKKEELILLIDYYEIFSLSNKAKKVTSEHLKALDDLIIKNKKGENIIQNLDIQNNKKNNIDLNDEDAISKLTNEIEKRLENSEDILNKKLEYEKLIKYTNNKTNNINTGEKRDIKNILEKYKNTNDRNVISAKAEKSNMSNNTSKTGFTNYTNIKENKNNVINNIIKNDNNEDKIPLMTNNSEGGFTFTTQELMSVPKYTLNKEKKEKKEISDNSSNKSLNNKTFYQNNQNNNINELENEKEIYKPKTPLKPLSKDKNNKINRSIISGNSNNPNSISFNTGKKIIPPIKSVRNSNNSNLKSKTNQRFDLFDDDGNLLNMAKFRGARKELVKVKMGGKSKMHELFTNKPRNVEENEKLRQKFMDFIQTGKENNKNTDGNTLKKSIVRKKIEDAQKFNKNKK